MLWETSAGPSAPATGITLDHFQMKLYGAQQAFSPQGWTANIDASDVVTWSFSGPGTPFNGGPLSLLIHSSSTASVPYGGIGNSVYPDGLATGPSVFVRFAYNGPAQVPEPSAFSFGLAAAVIFSCKRRYFVDCGGKSDATPLLSTATIERSRYDYWVPPACGKSIQNLLPLPNSDSTPTRPPIRSAPFFTMARPRPEPG
jgi:hypothetical protein